MRVIETFTQASHFRRGPEVYAKQRSPWAEPITSPYLERLEKGKPMFEVEGSWPWQEPFFPKVDDVRAAIAEQEQQKEAAA